MSSIIKIILALAAVLAVAKAEGYDGYKVFEVVPQTQKQTDFLHDLSKMEDLYDFFVLRKLPNEPARVMVNPNEVENFLNALSEHNLSFTMISDDVGRALESDFKMERLRYNLVPSTGRLSNDRYYSHAEITAYIEDLQARYPERVFLKTVGKSFEGRYLKTLTITNGDGRANKNVIFIDGGFHAREWLSPATAIYIIDQLVENFEENSELLLDYDIVVLPVVNPDGYEHTQISSSTRMWRKTRQPYESKGKVCYGADPNRNFGFHWNEEGTSPDPCKDNYAGPKPFSEPEVLVVRDLIHSYRDRGSMYLTIHSYGNYLLYPWGYTNLLPDTWPDLHEVAMAGHDAIFNATGTKYKVGSSTNVLYAAAGASDDYAFYSGFKISMTMELPAGGLLGFNPPVSSLDHLIKESWIGIRAMIEKVIEKYPTEKVAYL